MICGDLVKNANTQMNYSIDEVLNCIHLLRHDRDVAVIGMANAGKSTLLNALMNSAQLTTSRHPGTTLDFTKLPFEDFVIYDTPGLTRLDSLLSAYQRCGFKECDPDETGEADCLSAERFTNPFRRRFGTVGFIGL